MLKDLPATGDAAGDLPSHRELEGPQRFGKGHFPGKAGSAGAELSMRTLNHVRQRVEKDMTYAGELFRA
jgi:hypothetical protein